jgi:hypothetical protein
MKLIWIGSNPLHVLVLEVAFQHYSAPLPWFPKWSAHLDLPDCMTLTDYIFYRPINYCNSNCRSMNGKSSQTKLSQSSRSTQLLRWTQGCMSVLRTTSILLIDAVSRQTSALPSTDPSLCPTLRDHTNTITLQQGVTSPHHMMCTSTLALFTQHSTSSQPDWHGTAVTLVEKATVSLYTSTFSKLCPHNFCLKYIWKLCSWSWTANHI